ncbi:DoxX family protein [Terrimonas sp.]|uniref:DoxX family protein n=1 Tax=Terrimonas sp. TaxID=1914338 RepID=UPI000D5215EE|nr:DoxX family protein [Terrimonas sp.]PVD52671.1 DoxX family protein [Terrimonas sp.]
MKRIFSPDSCMMQEGLTFIRIIIGLLMVYHGWEVFDKAKMVEYAKWERFNSYAAPAVMVYIGKGAELISGVLLAFGLFTRIAAVILIITMLYICFKVGNGRFWYEDQHPFLFALLGLIYFFAGGGKYSIDNILFKKK